MPSASPLGVVSSGPWTSSIATIAPRPRTSPMMPCSSASARSRESIRSPIASARSASPSDSMASIEARAAAQAAGLPP